jgi:predicted RecB family nuclease
MCECVVCSGRPEVAQACRERGDPTQIYGISLSRAELLAGLGIHTLQDIADADPVRIREGLRPHKGHAVSEETIHGWKHHVRSYETNAPVYFGNERLKFADFIAVDLEYVSEKVGCVYLIGIATVENGTATFEQMWGEEAEEMRQNIQQLGAIVNAKRLPVLTWSGTSAEIPKLGEAVGHYELGGDLDGLFDRHYDLCAYAERNVRLPIPSLKLKSVGRFFGFYRSADVRGGEDADRMYRLYRRSTNPSVRAELKRVLMAYNREDVEALILVAQRFKGLVPQ